MNLLKYGGLLCAALLAGGCCCQAENEILLDEGWNVISSASTDLSGKEISSPGTDTEGWYDAVVPSTIMGTLTRNGVYTDALEGLNYKKIDKTLFDSPWWYRKEFRMPALKDGEHAQLPRRGVVRDGGGVGEPAKMNVRVEQHASPFVSCDDTARVLSC